MEKPLIKLYRIRTFGEKISDTFDFVRENFRPLLKYLTYLMLPLSLVQAFAQTNFMGGYMDFIEKMGKNVQQSSDVSQMLSWVGSMTLMVVVAEPVYAHWVPGLHVERSLTIAMAAYIFILIYSMRYS